MPKDKLVTKNYNRDLDKNSKSKTENFQYKIDQFADIQILRYQVPEFDKLSLKQKILIYYLNQASLSGRDIIFDQNYKHNLLIRKILEEILKHYEGNRHTNEFKQFTIYLKRVWFCNGIHHHYSTDKIEPDFSAYYLSCLIRNSNKACFPIMFKNKDAVINFLTPLLFDPELDNKRVCQDTNKDLVINSANNFYEGVTQKEAEDYYNNIAGKDTPNPVSYGLNSKLLKENGKIIEKAWGLNEMYSSAIKEIIKWLGKAKNYAENAKQEEVINKLIIFYKTGSLKYFDKYSILWVNDIASTVDFVNGFIETYGDALGKKGTWEALVNFKNKEATRRAEILSKNAQWFEDNSPIDKRFKKENVKGVTAKVVTAAILGGDCYPATPIGINLPNSSWIRKEHGSKSVTIENIIDAYYHASLESGFLEEFAYREEEIALARQYGNLAGKIHTDLHECLGHGSGQLLPNTTTDALKNYDSPIEEARADLFALYYIMDMKMVELGLIPSPDVAKAEYDNYIRNGLMGQLVRIQSGKNIEQAHMRNRLLISKWCYEKGKGEKVIEKIIKNGKTYFVVNDHNKLRNLFAKLLLHVQHIKSEGDYKAAKDLVETYGVIVDKPLHNEVLERYKKLNLAPYSGFVNPKYTPVMKDGDIVDVVISHSDYYTEQMLEYSRNYSFLE